MRTVIFSFMIVFTICIDGYSAITNRGYMTRYFYDNKPVYVNDSFVLELTNELLSDTPGDNYLNCDINIVTSSSRRLLVHFLSLEISYDDKFIDRLHIYDFKAGGAAVRLSPPQGLYGLSDAYYHPRARGVEDYVSTGNRLKLDYQGKPTLAYDGFKILITSFRDARGDCGRGYIRCNRKEICVPATTWCDSYANCGNDDASDETNCDVGLNNGYNPLDGQTTALVAASLACTVFLVAVGAVVFVILKVNKREKRRLSVSVHFKKKKATLRQMSNGDQLTRLYAPPSYEVVVGMDEDPPPYQAIADADDSGSDVEDGVFMEHVTQIASGTCAILPDGCAPMDAHTNQHKKTRKKSGNIRITSALVTRDAEEYTEGNVTYTSHDPELDDNVGNERLEQTNYQLCASALPVQIPSHAVISDDTIVVEQTAIAVESSEEIETVSSDDSSGHSRDENRNKRKPTDAEINILPNGKCNGHTSNVHARVTFKRSPSKREAADIEFIDDDKIVS